MIGEIEQALTDNGLASNTYIVFSSDNGLHTGEYRLMPGKMTAFDTDIHVPAGRDRSRGAGRRRRTGAMAENIDLAKTFEAIGGTDAPERRSQPVVACSRGSRRRIGATRSSSSITAPISAASIPTSSNPRAAAHEPTRPCARALPLRGVRRRRARVLRPGQDPFELHNLAAASEPDRPVPAPLRTGCGQAVPWRALVLVRDAPRRHPGVVPAPSPRSAAPLVSSRTSSRRC